MKLELTNDGTGLRLDAPPYSQEGQSFGVIQMKRRVTTDLGKTPAFKKRKAGKPSITQLQLFTTLPREK